MGAPVTLNRRPPTAETVEVIRVEFNRGNGVDDPVRLVQAFYTPGGELLAEHDPIPVPEALLRERIGKAFEALRSDLPLTEQVWTEQRSQQLATMAVDEFAAMIGGDR